MSLFFGIVCTIFVITNLSCWLILFFRKSSELKNAASPVSTPSTPQVDIEDFPDIGEGKKALFWKKEVR